MDCKGGCKMKAGGKTCETCGMDMDKMRSGGMACMKCGGKMHKSGGTVSSCMKCGGGKYTFGGKVSWSKKKVTSNSSEKYASGGMIKRADGSYSQRGLWDNIRANAGSGKEPTKQMLEQEKKIKQEMAVGGMVDYDCPPGMKRDPVKGCVSVWIYDNYGNKTPDNRPYMMNEIAGINKRENPIKYYEEGDPAGIKAKQMYADSLDMYNQSMYNIQNYKEQSIPTYKPIEKGSWMDMFYKNTGTNTPAAQWKVPKSQCNNDGVCIDIHPKPVQPIGFKKKTVSQPQMDPTQTVGYKISNLTQSPNTYEDRKYLAKIYDFEKKTGRPFTGTPADNVFLYEDLLKEKEKQKEEKKYYEELKNRIDNSIPEPAPRDNNEPDITLSKEPINMSMINSGLIPTKDIYQKITDIPKGNETETDEEILGKLKGKGLWRGAAGWVPLTDKEKIDFYKRGAEFKDLQEKDIKGPGFYSFGGAIKNYAPGGEIGIAPMNSDTEIQLSRGAFNVSEPAYDANKIMSRVFNNALSIKETEQPATEQTGYKKEVEKNQVVKDNKSLPNWGRAKKEQQILNELIRKDISSGRQVMPLLVEDDIIGDKTLGAMRAYEESGQYKRPELFKDKWLAEYKKQWQEMQKGKSTAGNQESKTESQTQPESKKTTTSEYSPIDWAKPYFPNMSKPEDKKPGWGVLSNETKQQMKPNGKGWPKEQLLKEGGVEIDSKELIPKDFDTYQPIKGISKSTKGVRATGRDEGYAYFDAAEKGQTYEKDGKKVNTSLGYIAELLSKSKKAIVIPKGQDRYGRDINDIYLQDETNPNQYHALDSSGVVKGEAIYGQWKTGEEGKMTDRQKMITGQAQEQGGFKYELSPWLFRETEKDKKSPTYKPSEEKKLKDLQLSEWKTTKILEYDRSGKFTNFVVKDPKTNNWKVVQIKDSYENLKGKEKIVTIDGKEQKIYIDPKLYK